MDTETTVFGGLLVVQLVGSVLLVASLFLSGLGLLTAVGGALIMVSIVGLAAATTLDEDGDEDDSVRLRDVIANRLSQLGRGSEP